MKLNLRLADVSQMSGLSVPTIRLLEQGRGNLSSLFVYLTALQLRLHWLGVKDSDHGEALAMRRKRLSVSQRALADKIGVSHRTIISLENKFRGRFDTLTKVLSALRLNPVIRSVDEIDTSNSMAQIMDDKLLSVLDSSSQNKARYALIQADALDALRSMPSAIVDCVMTSPPYWQQRLYAAGGIGEEQTVETYLSGLRTVFKQAHRVLKSRGSLWINIDDSYDQRSMQGIPWRLVLSLVEDSGWLIRNDVIWNKSGGGLNRADNRFTHRHEHLFHLVKQDDYYFDADAVRIPAQPARLDGPVATSATGVTQSACAARIASARDMTADQRNNAWNAVDRVFDDIIRGKLHDFRLILRGENRVVHSDSHKISARAATLETDGFYILRYNPHGSLPSDVWTIAPDRSKGRDLHYAAYPASLCEKPIMATCPNDGIILDPFVGTGTTLIAAQRLGRRGIGIDLSAEYLALTEKRLMQII